VRLVRDRRFPEKLPEEFASIRDRGSCPIYRGGEGTIWMCALAAGGIVWILYLLRLSLVTAQLQARLGERLLERERIARDLHDTPLQSFQGLVLHLEVVNELIPHGKAKAELTDLLQSYDWPGNIRELLNVIERSIILSSADVFSVDELWLSKRASPEASRAETSVAFNREAKAHSERETIEAALAESRGRISGPSAAAVKLGMPPSTLEDRIRALKIDKRRFKYG
jgi:Histidine kinase/Bacterial regulatory protein, Fis family